LAFMYLPAASGLGNPESLAFLYMPITLNHDVWGQSLFYPTWVVFLTAPVMSACSKSSPQQLFGRPPRSGRMSLSRRRSGQRWPAECASAGPREGLARTRS
jgi:hypothetical protein